MLISYTHGRGYVDRNRWAARRTASTALSYLYGRVYAVSVTATAEFIEAFWPGRRCYQFDQACPRH